MEGWTFDYMEMPGSVRLRIGQWHTDGTAPKGAVLLVNGRTEFMEKYEEACGRLAAMGLEVHSFDWRGQGLSSRLLENRRKGHVDSFDDYVSDMSRFVEEVFVPSAAGETRLLMGHSMGGHNCLRFLARNADAFDKAVLMSPMVDINTFPFPRAAVAAVVRAVAAAGYEKAYAGGTDAIEESRYEGNSLTHDRARFDRSLAYVAENPDLAVGGVTFGWLKAACESIGIIHEPGFARKIRTPVLLASASEDRVVCNRAQRRICRRLPRCNLVEIPGARHEILQETDEVQKVFWNAFSSFAFEGPDGKSREKT